LLSSIKFSGFTDKVRIDEMPWALQYVRDAYALESDLSCLLFLGKAAIMLGIDLITPAPMPQDLARRITNARVMQRRKPCHWHRPYKVQISACLQSLFAAIPVGV